MEDHLKSLTWDELADIFDAQTGKCARIMKMEKVFEWAKNQPDRFFVDEEGYLYQIVSPAALDK